MIYLAEVVNGVGYIFGVVCVIGVIYTTGGNVYIGVPVLKPCVNSYIHAIHELSGELQWNCSLASRFNLDGINQDWWNSSG